MRDCMNIYAQRGDKVRFAFPDDGYPNSIERDKELLTVGEVYTVDYVEVGSGISYVYLFEVPDEGFNTVKFEDI